MTFFKATVLVVGDLVVVFNVVVVYLLIIADLIQSSCAKKCSRKLNKGLCLSRSKNCANCDSRGFEPATPVAILRY